MAFARVSTDEIVQMDVRLTMKHGRVREDVLLWPGKGAGWLWSVKLPSAVIPNHLTTTLYSSLDSKRDSSVVVQQ